jgi:hypothetical protein
MLNVIEIQGEIVNCWRCGVSFVVPAHVPRNARRYARAFFCFNGHKNFMGEQPATDAEKELRKELARFKLKAIHERDQSEAKTAAEQTA